MEILNDINTREQEPWPCGPLYKHGVVPALSLCDGGYFFYPSDGLFERRRSGAFAWRGVRNRWLVRCFDHGEVYDCVVDADEMNDDDLFEVWDHLVGELGDEDRIVLERGAPGVAARQFPGKVVIGR